LLEQLIRIEEGFGRTRNHAKNVSRTIDIDLLYCGSSNIENELLQLPHPRIHLRKFVLQPLADIRAKLVLPNHEKSVRELLEELKQVSEVVRFKEDW
jgi:2-amino-4-hydroxy-6-hydroxymethyldihydropteridine diphosphokinase